MFENELKKIGFATFGNGGLIFWVGLILEVLFSEGLFSGCLLSHCYGIGALLLFFFA